MSSSIFLPAQRFSFFFFFSPSFSRFTLVSGANGFVHPPLNFPSRHSRETHSLLLRKLDIALANFSFFLLWYINFNEYVIAVCRVHDTKCSVAVQIEKVHVIIKKVSSTCFVLFFFFLAPWVLLSLLAWIWPWFGFILHRIAMHVLSSACSVTFFRNFMPFCFLCRGIWVREYACTYTGSKHARAFTYFFLRFALCLPFHNSPYATYAPYVACVNAIGLLLPI